MSLRRRGGIWWIDYFCPNGQRVRQSAGTASKALAQELHDKLKAESWRIAKLGERPWPASIISFVGDFHFFRSWAFINGLTVDQSAAEGGSSAGALFLVP